jgi:hypothetical protein
MLYMKTQCIYDSSPFMKYKKYGTAWEAEETADDLNITFYNTIPREKKKPSRNCNYMMVSQTVSGVKPLVGQPLFTAVRY